MSKEKLSMIEKLKDVLTRNYSTIRKSIIITKLFPNYDLLEFKMHSDFSSNDLNGIFRYWGVDWNFYVKEWHVKSNNNLSVRVQIFIYNNIECNEHDFRVRRDWGQNIQICNKCGLFSKINQEKIEVK